MSNEGDIILLEVQDRSLWNRAFVDGPAAFHKRRVASPDRPTRQGSGSTAVHWSWLCRSLSGDSLRPSCWNCRRKREFDEGRANMVHPTEACAEPSGRFFDAWLSYPMIVQKCVPDEQTLARDRQHHWRTALAGKRWRPRYPSPSQHLCKARLRFSRQCQSKIDNHIPQINPSIREPCLENLGRTLPSDKPQISRFFFGLLSISSVSDRPVVEGTENVLF
ncbi:hypothetical protein CA85_37950 [Allorhodopirellula solitaria]|uniref:Uncharacterized protein n=1 Tax=Allorhodopirellula solitaria TaxID=2527987 RepID=A0A5C5XSJ7_9BACT|nr:hypothetical protein CA85_37950 [Allorhodopirellula solitaria]